MKNITVNCDGIKISNEEKICLIAGPCQLETEQHALDMACLLYTSPSPRDS